MTRRKPRHLSSEEEALWQRVARTTRRMDPAPETKSMADVLQPAAPDPTPQPREAFEIKPFRVGSKTTTALSEGGPAQKGYAAPAARPNLDRSTLQKLRRGKARPEGRIDLHGLTADEALAELTGFLFHAHGLGKRLVLVITGKGRPGDDAGPIPTRVGVLRRSLPEWVKRPPLNAIVHQAVEAHAKHGGSGAFYVYLRKSR